MPARSAVLKRALLVLPMVAASGAAPALAATGVPLPAWVCSRPDAIYAGRFDAADGAVPHAASQGSGGAYPGNSTRTVSVPRYGNHDYYVHVPAAYTPSRSWPILLALEGAAGTVSGAINQAQTMRADWKTLSEWYGFIVAAPVASGSNGGWIEPAQDGSGPSDYDVIAAVIADLEAAYNVERTRRYAWGFSAGGEVLHDIVLSGWSGMSADTFAGYAVTGAVLAGCPTYLAPITWCVPANATRTIPLDIQIGSSDPYIPLSYARSDETAFEAAGWALGNTLFYTEFTDGTPAGGHTISSTGLNRAWADICPNAVTP